MFYDIIYKKENVSMGKFNDLNGKTFGRLTVIK